MGNFFTDTVQRDARLHSLERVADAALLWPPFRIKIARIIRRATERKQEFVLFETFRSVERQAALFEQGRSKLRRVGVHHYGLAADLVRRVNGQLDWEADYALVGELARAEGLVWGGEWKSFPDVVHIQAIPVALQAKLFAGNYYPSFPPTR